MNDKEPVYEEIDEMKQIACNALNNDNCPECGDDRCGMCRRIARMFKQAGYRKEKYTAKEILDEVSKHFGGDCLVELYKKYSVEVGKQ